MKKEPITAQGKEKIEEELKHLIKVEREDLKRVIAEARELGDLKENAEYHSAKEKQSHVEGRILQLQAVLANADVISPANIESEKVVFGATVTLLDLENDKSNTFQIVGKDETDRDAGKISYSSPLGQALMGKEEGDTIVVKAPKGNLEYQIESIEYK